MYVRRNAAPLVNPHLQLNNWLAVPVSGRAEDVALAEDRILDDLLVHAGILSKQPSDQKTIPKQY
jgi:hypothetical protein